MKGSGELEWRGTPFQRGRDGAEGRQAGSLSFDEAVTLGLSGSIQGSRLRPAGLRPRRASRLPRAGSAGAPRLWAGREGAGSLRWAGSPGPEVRVGRGRGGDCGRAGGAVSAGVAGPE